MGLDFKDKGSLTGRVLAEAMPGGATPDVQSSFVASDPDAAGRRTVLAIQAVGAVRYLDAGGFVGRTLGLAPEMPPGAP